MQTDPSLSLAFNARGYAYLRLKQYAKAISDFDRAIQLNPEYVNAYSNRAAAKKAAGDKPGADADLTKIRTLAQR